ncbi:S-layer homology domain-containing protein [Agathobaculum butyriciproducens]|uniref:S-layer homology domain-containing protein n=1 Tax=Agathobaculum butyriciproducens TaxID=1628085 RepID=A0AAW4W1V2_9FIRM|nr:S-layer homology domain-containing protein [Agathobaculum butyriciproducens]
MKKRVLSLFMALALCFSMLPTAALAEEAGAAPDAANADSTYTTGENAGLAGGEDDSAPEGTDSGEAQDGEADTAVSAVQEAHHANHCVCGGNGDVNGHNHDTAGTEWKTADSLPTSAGNYYLTQSVSGSWTVPTGEVNLCLNGQTINGKITVGSGATLTLTDCTGSGRVQGEVIVNGGKFELYDGTITGGVQVGIKGGSYQTGSNFTMYGGTISGNSEEGGSGGGVFLVGTTIQTDPPSFTMNGGTISNNTAAASDGGGGGVYVGEKCSFTMDGGTITGNTATNGNGGGIYIHMLSRVTISGGEITNNTASGSGIRYGGGIYSESGVTVSNVKITGNNANVGGGIYGKGAIKLTDATVADNSGYDVYYDGQEGTTPELTVSGSVKAGYYANYAWKLPILVSGALSKDSVIRVGVREDIKPNAGGSLLIAEPADGVTLSTENFKADAADCVTSLGDDGNVYLVPCTHEMDDTGYTCKKCHTQFDARVGESAYYQTLTKAFDAARGNTVTLLRDVTLAGNCSSSYTYPAILDLNGKTVSSERYYISVGGGNKPTTLTVKDSGTGGGTQALDVTFYVSSNGTLAVGDSYTGKISCVELQAGGALERFGGEIGELVLSNAAYGSTSTGYGLKLWNGNTNACTIGRFENTTSKSLTVNDLLKTNHAKCELYGEKDGAWSIVDKSAKIVDLKGYTAYKVQFPECVHQCADDSNPVCSVCHKNLYTKITAKTADGTTKTAYFTEDSALENGYVEAIQTLNGWSNKGCTEPTLTLLRDMYAFDTSMPLTGTLTLEGGTHTAKNVTVAENANVTFASGSYRGATINGTATVKEGVTFTTASVEVNGTLNVEGGTFNGPVEFKGSSIANISGGNFTNDKSYEGVEFDYSVTGTISGGTFAFAWFYTTKVKLSGGTFTTIKTNGDRKLADLLAEGAAYYGASDNQAVTNDSVNTLKNVKVTSHTHNGGTDGKGTCSICGKQMTASLTVGGTTSWYTAFATAIEAANAADGAKTITLYQNVDDTVYGKRTAYELTRGPVTLATGGKRVDGVDLIAKGISLTVTGSNGGFYVTVDGKDAELTVNDKNTELAIVTAQNGGKLSLSNGTFSRVAVKDDGSSASLSGGSYSEITSDTGYVKPYALLAKGYAYKKTKDNQWLTNANSIPSEVTVEKAPFAVEKIYPNNDTGYTGNSAFATDGSITLTAVIAPEMEGVTYYYWWELFDESENDWTTHFGDVNTATHDGKQSKTLSISNLPENSSYQYHVYVSSNNGYNCYSEPFTVTRHQHSWTYTASGATITASCTDTTCTSPNGGSVTIAAPAELTYNGKGKPATVAASSDWQGPAASGITISYIKADPYIQQLENSALPTNAGTYTASIKLGEATASVEYTIDKAALTVTPKGGQRKKFGATDPTLTYAYSGEVSGETPAFDGALSRDPGEDVGTYNITKGSLELKDSGTFKATNYNLVLDTAVVTFEITKGTYGGSTPTKTVNILKNYAGVQTGTLTAADFFTTVPAEAKITVLPSPGTVTIMSSVAVDASGNLTYRSKPNIAATADENCAVTISSKNYTDIIATLTFKLVDKTDVSAQITFPNGTLTYNGAGQKYEKATISTTAAGTPAWTYTYAPADATASLDSAGLPKTAGTYTVTAKYEDDAHIGTKNSTLTVSKATPTGAPTCTKITTSGKTLADAPLAIGTIAPAGGTLAWDMAATTVVAANTAYGWTYTPADTANYKALTGSLTPYAVSSGGGGGGSSAATPSVSDKAAKELKNAKEGSTVTIDMKGETKLPASVTKEIAGKDVTVELDMGGGMVWSFNGLDVPKGGVSLDLGVKTGTKTIPAKVINALTGEMTTIQLQLNHNGPFGMSLKLSVDLGKKHDGLYANLYFYNPKSSALEFRSAGMISGGKASWVFDHASDYAIVIDKESHEPMTFTDVPDTAYYAGAVNWAVAKKITEGVGNNLFGPNDPCTRAQIVTFLWRAAGSPGPKTMSGFSDVPADSYYAKAVAWAVENGITGGTGDGKFSPDAICTRAQAVTFLYRASGAPAVSGNAAFSDVATNAYYAAAVKWAEKNGITGGIGGGLFGSDNNCTRAQIVTFLYRNYQSK